jgi:leucyl aminopeptidase
MKNFGPLALWLVCATPAFAEGPEQQDKEVWITIGTEAVGPARAMFAQEGFELPAPAREKAGVAVVRLRESRLAKLSEMMHDKFNRCAGYIAHASEEEALKALEPAATAPQSLAVSYTLNNATVVNSLIAGLQETNVRSTITSLSSYTTRYYTSQTGVDAATWLKNQWTTWAAGRSDVTVSFVTHAGWRQPSVMLTIQGTTLPGEIVVIGGHLDSINTGGSTLGAPGADDDASGIASFSEVIRVAMAQGYRPQRTVKFIAYAAEEVGLKGSAEIANQHKAAGANVVGVLQLDMTNYRGSSVDVGMVTDYTNAAQNSFITNLISTYLPGVTWSNTTCGYGCSDHASWTSAGYPASIPFESLVNQSNPYIHSTSDTISRSGSVATHALKFSKIAAAYLAELAKGTVTSSPPPTGTVYTATYDATLRAPKCASVGIGCDSGSLLNGRGTMGPESNAPNTINGSCADGNSGTYHSDESNDRIKVSTTDGTNLAAGKQVRVEATAWVYSTTADRLELYYAANATSPVWTLIGTITPPGTGARTMSATYTLPTGSTLQAVRARFRYQGSAGACGTGSYIDHDDLVFAVQ